MKAPDPARSGASLFGVSWAPRASGGRPAIPLRCQLAVTVELRRGHGDRVAGCGTQHAALTDGVEWNLRLEQARDPAAFGEVASRWDDLWALGRVVDDAWLDAYTDRAELSPAPLLPGDLEDDGARPELPPLRDVQVAALTKLAEARRRGSSRALVVMATGMGKTRVAVEDAVRFAVGRRPLPRVLVLAHRTELLSQAGDAFEAAVPGVRLSCSHS